MKDFFDINGKFYTLCSRIVDMVLLSFLWMICILSVILVIPATTALYYATVRSVRYERGRAVSEYWQMFRRTVRRDLPFSTAAGVGLLLAGIVFRLCLHRGASAPTDLFTVVCTGMLALLLITVIFWRSFLGTHINEGSRDLFLQAYVTAIRFFIRSMGMLILTGTGLLASTIFPPFFMIMPSLIMYLAFYIVEPVIPFNTPDEEREGSRT